MGANYLKNKGQIIWKQEGQRCPKRRVAQAAIRLATGVIKFRKERKEMLGHPVKVNLLDVLRNVNL